MSEKEFIAHPHPASQRGPNTRQNDLDYCRGCGQSGDPAHGGYYVDDCDVGPDAAGGVAELFELTATDAGRTWDGFAEDDTGYWCESCSWELQRKRTTPPDSEADQ